MTINHANNETLLLQGLSRYIVTMMTVEDGVKSKVRISITQLRDINFKIYHFKNSKHNHVSENKWLF